MKVVFYEVQHDLKQKPILTVTWQNDKIHFQGEKWMERVVREGVAYHKHKAWKIEDGKEFVEALPYEYSGSRLYAVRKD